MNMEFIGENCNVIQHKVLNFYNNYLFEAHKNTLRDYNKND